MENESSLRQQAITHNISPGLLNYRLNILKMELQDALNMPVKKIKKCINKCGRSNKHGMNYAAYARDNGINYTCFYNRIRMGLTPEQAINYIDQRYTGDKKMKEKKVNISKLCRQHKVKYSRVCYWMKEHKLTLEDAIEKSKTLAIDKMDSETSTRINEMMENYNVSRQFIIDRRKTGYTMDQIEHLCRLRFKYEQDLAKLDKKWGIKKEGK